MKCVFLILGKDKDLDNLKIIENNLVPVYETSTGEKVVYGSELHDVLGVKSPYREWSARRLKDCDALEDEDYTSVEISTLSGGSPKKEHIIKLDTAKEMAMLERNEKGKQVRRYFIQIEKKYKEMEKGEAFHIGKSDIFAEIFLNKQEKDQTILNMPSVKSWEGQRVVTFKDIDYVHQRPSGTAKRNFNKNKKYFIVGEDFYEISPYEFRTAFYEEMDSRQQNNILIFTESGYLMLVKSFRDDLSWNVQRQLVNGYFRGRELAKENQAQSTRASKVYSSNVCLVPLKQSWYINNEDLINEICQKLKLSTKELIHIILSDLGRTYDLKAANKIYKEQKGYQPEYSTDIIAYFPELEKLANDSLNSLCRIANS